MASIGTAHAFPNRCAGSSPATTSCRTRSDDTPRMLDASARDTRSDGMASNLLDFSNRFNPIDGRDYLVSRKGRTRVGGLR